jgi:hypothetical protein
MIRRVALFAAALCAILLSSGRAQAYPWMIRHGYSACGACHADPSGAGILTAYGRAQSSILLSSQYGAEDADPSSLGDALLGIVAMPDWLQLQGWFRNAYLWNDVNRRLVDRRFLQMRADLGAYVDVGALRASATIGYNVASAATQADRAWITRANPNGNIVSREHWLGVAIADDSVLLRAGRINLPFGLRNIEHTAWVRSETRTDINQSQEHGVSVAYSGESWRAEAMGIAGNFQIHPDLYRERGYAAFAEYIAYRYATLGVSSLVTHAAADILTQRNTTRQSHGIFARAAPWQPLVILGELDSLIVDSTGQPRQLGYVGFLQLDLEPVQGLHGMATSEILGRTGVGEHTNLGWWLSLAWFAVPHIDARADVIWRTTIGVPDTLTYLLQLQAYL